MSNQVESDKEDEYYALALEELKTGRTVPHLQAKAIAFGEGDKQKAAAYYIKLRVAHLVNQAARASKPDVQPAPVQQAAAEVPQQNPMAVLISTPSPTPTQVPAYIPEPRPVQEARPIQQSPVYKTQRSIDEDDDEKIEPHPWRRFFAKLLDVAIYSPIPLFLLFMAFPSVSDAAARNAVLASLLAFFFAQIVDSFILFATGSSIGRFLFGIRVVAEENNTLFTSLQRGMLCFVRGLLFSVFSMAYQYDKLKKNGQTSWDKDTGYRVFYDDVGAVRITFGAIALVALIVVNGGVFNMADKQTGGSGMQDVAVQDESKTVSKIQSVLEPLEDNVNKISAEEQFDLGWKYSNGKGVEKNDVEAARYFRMAAEQGHAPAQRFLGGMYIRGAGVTQSEEEAIKWWSRAAEQGDAIAQNNLGAVYGGKNDAEALKWYRKAAEQGQGSAQNMLGVMYMEGRGVPQSDTESAKWFRLAAEQGDAEGQMNLGNLFAQGRSVVQSNSEAMMWYRFAAEEAQYWRMGAEAGSAGAQFMLGLSYEFGWEVVQSDIEAIKWYRKAAAQGNNEAIKGLKRLRAN